MWWVLTLLVAVYSQVTIPYSNPNEVSFNRHDQNLPWPLTRPTDRHHLIAHGPHCVEIVSDFLVKPPRNALEKMHAEHCLRLLQTCQDFLVNNEYSIPDIVCQDFNFGRPPPQSLGIKAEGINYHKADDNKAEGINYHKAEGINYHKADGINYHKADGINYHKADGINYNKAEGINYHKADGINYHKADGINYHKADGINYHKAEGINYNKADGINYHKADGINYHKADGINYHKADGINYNKAEGINYHKAEGINYHKADGINYHKAEGINYNKAEGINYHKADGINYHKADGINYQKADGINYHKAEGINYNKAEGINYHKADGINYHKAEGINYNKAEGINYHHKVDGINYHKADGINYHKAEGINYHKADGINYNKAEGINYHKADGINYHKADGINYHKADGINYNKAEGINYNKAEGINYELPDDEVEAKFDGISHWIASKSHTQDEYFMLLGGQNFGDLLMKEWETPDALTEAEQDYHHQWHSPSAIRLASFGIKCSGYSNILEDVINQGKELSTPQTKQLRFPNGITEQHLASLDVDALSNSSFLLVKVGNEDSLDLNGRDGLEFIQSIVGESEPTIITYQEIPKECSCMQGWTSCNIHGRCCCQAA